MVLGCSANRIQSEHRTFIAGLGHQLASAGHFFIINVIRHETTAATPWASLLIVRTLFNDAFTIAVWTGFHVCLSVALSSH
jgi:hypothetical protein